MICGDQMWEPGCVHSKQNQKEGHDPHARDREFEVGTQILVKGVRDSSWNLGLFCGKVPAIVICGEVEFRADCSSACRPS